MKSYRQATTFVLLCLTYSLSIILNTLGICTLSNLRHELTNQRILLMNLSITELVYTSGVICSFLIYRFQHLNGSTFGALFTRFTWFFRHLYLTSPLLLTMDRFFAIAFPWKYRGFSTKAKALMMIFSTWICVASITVPLVLRNDHDYQPNYILDLAIEVTVIVFAIVAYTVIGLIVLRQRRLTGRANSESKVLKVAAAIIVTFVLFEVVPSLVLTVVLKYHPDTEKGYMLLIYLPTSFNTISDPIIYIYNYPPLKATVKKKLMPLIGKLRCLQQRSFTIAVPRPDQLSDTPL